MNTEQVIKKLNTIVDPLYGLLLDGDVYEMNWQIEKVVKSVLNNVDKLVKEIGNENNCKG
jgi:hypothetical protein